MQECCKNFETYQAIFVPKCNCYACWREYFLKHSGEFLAAATTLKQIGRSVIVQLKGEKYVRFLERVVADNEELIKQLNTEEKTEA